MSVRNLDYEILEFVCNSKTPVHMCDISSRFKSAGRSIAVDLCKQRLLYWHTLPGDVFNHDDQTCVIEITQAGLAEYGRFKYDQQLKTREVWKERIVGYILGVFTPITVYFFTEFLIPLICKQ